MELLPVESGVVAVDKKRLGLWVVLLLVCLCGSFLSYQTYAYLTDRDRPGDNKFTVGNVDIRINEQFTPVTGMTVGTKTYPKRVTFTNRGRNDAYVRVLMAKSNGDVDAKISRDGSNFYTFDDYPNHLSTNWAYKSTGVLGGYYYYKKPLKPGESTDVLITNVRVTFHEKTADTNLTVNQTPRDFEIYIYAEGLQQYKLNGSGKHTSYETAWTEFLNRK